MDVRVPGSAAWAQDREELVWVAPVAFASAFLFLAGQIAGFSHGITSSAVFADYSLKAATAIPLLLVLVLSTFVAKSAMAGVASPVAELRSTLRQHFRSPLLTLAAFSPLLLMPVLFSGYGVLKMLMPIHSPFAMDDSFAAADRLLFLGRQPWTLTHAVFGSFEATLVIDRIYTVWVLLVSVAVVGFALFSPPRLRAQFFLALTFGWILLGVIGAYLLSSAGPCYSMLVKADSAPEFALLMERLHEYSATRGTLGAVEWQQILWTAHERRGYGFGMGISAMPSLHNAVSVLYALALSQFGRRIAIAVWTFAGTIFIGSVHLGWHYAVDGIVGAAVMVLVWKLAGKYLDRRGYPA
ncbi:MAG TPA: phosphatase PAP2 family protein [Allosphingosinicella sp.]